LNVLGVDDDKNTEIHKAKPLLPEPCAFESEMVIENVKRYK
jgi:hypothetical protein